MMFSAVFISEAISPNSPFSAQAQVKVKRGNNSIASRTYRGGKYVGRKPSKAQNTLAKRLTRAANTSAKKVIRAVNTSARKPSKAQNTLGKKTVGGTKKVFSKLKKLLSEIKFQTEI
jgi:hypothetical protein